MDIFCTDVKMWRTCVAFGCFDGMHRGHLAVVSMLVELAQARKLMPVLISNNRDQAKDGEKILTSEAEKHLHLLDSGLAAVLSIDFSEYLPSDLINLVTVKLGAEVLVIGEHDERREWLEQECVTYGVQLITCPTVNEEGMPISTERAMEALRALDFDLLQRLLGHPYTFYGKVGYGKQVGRTISIPTANIQSVPNKLLPPEGSYGAISFFAGIPYIGTANIGRRPTVDDFAHQTIENHLIGFSGDLYGQYLQMELHLPIRGVTKFEKLEDLRVQVQKDIRFVHEQLDDKLRQYKARA